MYSDLLQHFFPYLHVDWLIISVNHLESMTSIAVHMTISLNQTMIISSLKNIFAS